MTTMGIVTSIFRRKKDIIEILEALDEEINTLENRKRQNLDLQKRVIGSLILYSMVFYITGAIIFFVYYFPTTWKYRFLYSLPLLAFPFLIYVLKRLLHWYFVQRISHNDKTLRIQREKKKKMLEDVMEKETYKKAMKILERFDPMKFNRMDIEGPRSLSVSRQSSPEPRNGSPRETPAGTEVRFRGGTAGGPSMTPSAPQATPSGAVGHLSPAVGARPASIPRFGPQQTPMAGRGAMPLRMRPNPPGMAPGPGRGMPGPPQLARPILPRERTPMDRVIDLLIGDGPERRYALICANCSSHNGMALQEEFEYMSFRCCYCGFMNPARKMRPRPPAQLFSQASVSSSVEPSCGEEDEEDDPPSTPTTISEADRRGTPPLVSQDESKRSSEEPETSSSSVANNGQSKSSEADATLLERNISE